jgi:hypothetical protein
VNVFYDKILIETIMEIVKGNFGEVLSGYFKKAKEGFICTPYFTRDGLNYLKNFLKKGERLEFWTKFNVIDWVNEFSDLSFLSSIIKDFEKRGCEVLLYVYDDLHAKIYMANNTHCFMGSPNLTIKGLITNLEILIKLSEEEIKFIKDWINTSRSNLIYLKSDDLIDYIDVTKDAFKKLKKNVFDLESKESEDLNAAITLAEELLLSRVPKKLKRTEEEINFDKILSKVPKLEIFIKYCEYIMNEDSDANEIVERYNGKLNLSGHVKHSYYGSVLFLRLNKDLISVISKWNDNETIKFQIQPWFNLFCEFLSSNTNYINEKLKFSFRTLRVYLPENIGGTTTGGGGGIGTFRRVLRLTSLMFKEVK